MLSIILITLLDVFNDCEIIFFSVEEGNCVMDADIDVTGKIEFFYGGVKFDVIWFRELINVDIVDSSMFDIVELIFPGLKLVYFLMQVNLVLLI